MHSLTNEEKIILLLSRLSPSTADIEHVAQVVFSDIKKTDFRKVTQLSARNGVAPLLYRNSKNLKILPDEALLELRNIYYHAMFRNFKALKEVLRLLDLFKRRNVDAIPLRGGVASEVIFGNPALYYGSDIDLLVRPAQLEEAKCILIDSGYRYDEQYERELLSAHYHFVFHNGNHFVEIHWNLVKRYFQIPPEFWWEDTCEAEYNGTGMLSLSPEKYLLSAIFRLFSHMFHPLKFFVLVSELCNTSYENIDWPRFARYTNAFGMERLAGFTLKLSNELLGTRVPESIINRTFVGYRFFKASIIKQLFRDVRRSFAGKPLYIFLLDSPLHIFNHFLMRIFPKRGELRLRYGIPNGSRAQLLYYYLLNPFLLPFLVLRKRVDAHIQKSSQAR